MKLIPVFLFICLTKLTAQAQHNQVPVLHASSDNLIMYLDGQRDDFNGINKLGPHFSYAFVVPQDSSVFKLVSESDSISMVLKPKKNSVFKIVREAQGDTVTCAFSIQKLVKPASFNDAYKIKNEGKTSIEIPEVYELINIIIALTRYGETNAIYKDTDYYKKVITHFTAYRQEAAVQAVDSLLQLSPEFFYLHLKMDSYAYIFSGDKIVNGGIYDRISSGEKNELDPYIPVLETFAGKSGFRAFYKKQLPYYTSLKKDYTDNIDVSGMKNWLTREFPAIKNSAVKVIFSPLVGWNQSASSLTDNGFTEAQAHVNFPFINEKDKAQPAGVLKGQRMMIAFTEINHAYLNPEAEKHEKAIHNSFKDLSKWITPGKPSAGYDNALVCFEEYMNYGLVTLFYSDIFDQKTFASLNDRIENNMTESRGFQQFKAFNQELLRLYKNRKRGQTVADLYPDIINWASGHADAKDR